MNTKTLQKIGGFFSISLGLIYIIAFIVYGGILDYPKADATDTESLHFLIDNYVNIHDSQTRYILS